MAKEILSASPSNPIVVVKIRIIGPTKASELFTTNAFPTSLYFNIRIAAKISMLPDKILRVAMPKTAFSIKLNMISSCRQVFCEQYMQEIREEGQGIDFNEWISWKKCYNVQAKEYLEEIR